MRQTVLFLFSLLLLSACKEEALTPEVKNITEAFLPAADDTSEEAAIRRQFHADHRSYLLFNDTLQHRLTGYDVDGTPHYFTERVDLTYEIGMSSTSNTRYGFTLLADIEQKQQAVSFLEGYVLSHIDGQLRPYSWLLVSSISRTYLGTPSSPYAASGQRCIAVATSMLSRLKDSQKPAYATQVLGLIIGDLANNNRQAFTDFFRVSQGYYDDSFPTPATTAENTRILGEAGFVVQGQSYGANKLGLYPSQELDLTSFAKIVVSNTEEKLATTYARYPLILEKINLMRQTLIALGYRP